MLKPNISPLSTVKVASFTTAGLVSAGAATVAIISFVATTVPVSVLNVTVVVYVPAALYVALNLLVAFDTGKPVDGPYSFPNAYHLLSLTSKYSTDASTGNVKYALTIFPASSLAFVVTVYSACWPTMNSGDSYVIPITTGAATTVAVISLLPNTLFVPTSIKSTFTILLPVVANVPLKVDAISPSGKPVADPNTSTNASHAPSPPS